MVHFPPRSTVFYGMGQEGAAKLLENKFCLPLWSTHPIGIPSPGRSSEFLGEKIQGKSKGLLSQNMCNEERCWMGAGAGADGRAAPFSFLTLLGDAASWLWISSSAKGSFL